MAMKVKAVEKLLKFDKNSAGVYRYVMLLAKRNHILRRNPSGEVGNWYSLLP